MSRPRPEPPAELRGLSCGCRRATVMDNPWTGVDGHQPSTPGPQVAHTHPQHIRSATNSRNRRSEGERALSGRSTSGSIGGVGDRAELCQGWIAASETRTHHGDCAKGASLDMTNNQVIRGAQVMRGAFGGRLHLGIAQEARSARWCFPNFAGLLCGSVSGCNSTLGHPRPLQGHPKGSLLH